MRNPLALLKELVYLRRQALAAERQAAALEQLVLILSKATGVSVGSFRTFYRDKSPKDSDVEFFATSDEELWELEQEELKKKAQKGGAQ